MPEGQRNTPITDFLYRLEVDPAFVEKFLDDPHAAAEEFGGMPEDAVAALVNKDLATLQDLVDAEHPDRVIIIPRGWVH